jgi:hypothetical protein
MAKAVGESHRHSGVDQSEPQVRLTEIGELLAAGLVRVQARKSSGKSRETRENPLDFSGSRSGHRTTLNGRISDG